jgi:hypothetical protein
VNVAEKVATLEALLKKIQRNAAAPRPRAQDVASPGAGSYGGLRLGGEPGTPTGAARGVPAPPPARGSEPSWDDVIHAIEAEPPEGFPGRGEPRLTALAAPLHKGTAPAQARPGTAAKQPAAPAAKQPAAPAAKQPAAPAAKQPADRLGSASAGAAPQAKAPGTPAARPPAAETRPTARMSDPNLLGQLLEDDDLEGTDLNFPPAEVAKQARKAAGEPGPAPKAAPKAAEPKVAPRAAAPAEPKVAPRAAAPAEPKAAPPKATPRVEATPPRAEAKPFFGAQAQGPKAPDFDSELSFADVLPVEPPKPVKPVEVAPAPVPVAAPAPVEVKKTAEEKRRAHEEKTVERNILADVAADDEPTIIRTGMEDEPTVVRTRPPGIDDDETVVASERSEAQLVARSISDDETVASSSVEIAAAKLREEVARETPKPEDKPAAEEKPAAAEEKPEKKEEPKQFKPVADTIPLPVSPPEPRRRSSWGLALAAALLIGGAVFIAIRAGWFNTTAPTPPPPTATGEVGTAAPPGPSTQPDEVGTAAAGTPTPPPAESAAAPPASAAAPPASAAAQGDGSELPGTEGYLHVTVTSPEPLTVYVNAKPVGNANEKLKVRCGTAWVRVGKPTNTAEPDWRSPGQTAVIGCKTTTNLTIKLGASPPPVKQPGTQKPPPDTQKPPPDTGDTYP